MAARVCVWIIAYYLVLITQRRETIILSLSCKKGQGEMRTEMRTREIRGETANANNDTMKDERRRNAKRKIIRSKERKRLFSDSASLSRSPCPSCDAHGCTLTQPSAIFSLLLSPHPACERTLPLTVYILVQYSCHVPVRDVHPRLCSAWRLSELQKNSLR